MSGGRRNGSHIGLFAMVTMCKLRLWKKACAASSLNHLDSVRGAALPCACDHYGQRTHSRNLRMAYIGLKAL